MTSEEVGVQKSSPHRPLLRYPGGKWLLAPWIIAHFPPHQCYVEPFAGAASVLLQKPQAYAEVLNDVNQDIVALFRILRDPQQATLLTEMLRLTPYARSEYDEAYVPAGEPLEQARRFLIRSWQGFNGEGALGFKSGWRSNADRRGTLPAHDWARFPDALAAIVHRLAGVIIENDDALEILGRYDGPQTLFYVDPPYDAEVCPFFNGYRATISPTALWEALTHCHGMVAVSGYHSPTYDALYASWRCVECHAYAGTGKAGTRQRRECLWLNRACAHHISQLSLW